MPRALVLQSTTTGEAERGVALDTFRVRRDQLRGSGCNYWVFEQADQAGVFTQCFEAPDPDTLQRARRDLLGVDDTFLILREVEL